MSVLLTRCKKFEFAFPLHHFLGLSLFLSDGAWWKGCAWAVAQRRREPVLGRWLAEYGALAFPFRSCWS